MRKQPAIAPFKNLRDAYKVPGFHVRAKLDSHELDGYAIAVLTLDRRSKKACAEDAKKRVSAFTTRGGSVCAIWRVATAKSISMFRCAA